MIRRLLKNPIFLIKISAAVILVGFIFFFGFLWWKNNYLLNQNPPWLIYPCLAATLLLGSIYSSRQYLRIGYDILLILVSLVFLLPLWNSFPIKTTSTLRYFKSFEINKHHGNFIPKGSLASPYRSKPYLSCYFELKTIWDHINVRPKLCVGYDLFHRVQLHFNEQKRENEMVREIQFKRFGLQNTSLMGESYQRETHHWSYRSSGSSAFILKAIYVTAEKEFSNHALRTVETFTYDGEGDLIRFTESSLLNLTSRNVFAIYNEKGELITRPNLGNSFIFPSKIQIGKQDKYILNQALPY